MLLNSAVSLNERAKIIVCGSAVLFDFQTLLILMTEGDCSKVRCSEVPEPLKLILHGSGVPSLQGNFKNITLGVY